MTILPGARTKRCIVGAVALAAFTSPPAHGQYVAYEYDDSGGVELTAKSTAMSQSSRIRSVFARWKSAVRSREGETACGLMTPRFRAWFRQAYDAEGGWDSCVELIEVNGRGIYSTARGFGSLAPVRRRGRRASARVKNTDAYWFFLRDQDGRWRLHDPPTSDLHRYDTPGWA